MTVIMPTLSTSSDERLWFRTGHGRLFWRVSETPHEEPETNSWIAGFEPDDVFFDVGANIGLYSMAAARFRGVCTVAVEPDLMNARLLYENVLRNGLGSSVTVIPVALDATSHLGSLHLKTLAYGDALHNLDGPSLCVRDPSDFIASIPVFALDDLVRVLGLRPPTRLKVDVDGRELSVLEGAVATLKVTRDVMIEVDLDLPSSSVVTAFLNIHGFQLQHESEPTVAWNRCVNRLFSRRGGARSERRSPG
jgi:FkbM family methyltransferase